MKIHQQDLPAVFATLRSTPAGLSPGEAERRLREFGANALRQIKRKGLLRELLEEFTHFFAIILWIAALLAFVSGWREPGSGMRTLGCAIVAVVVINGLFSLWQKYRAEKTAEALKRLLPRNALVRRDGAYLSVPSSNLVPGDVISLSAGDLVSADARIIESADLRVNKATITGESVPQFCHANVSAEQEIQNSDNVLLAGTSVLTGEAKAVVFATGANTIFSQIAIFTQAEKETETPLLVEIARLSRVIAVLAISCGLIFYFAGARAGLSFGSRLMFAIGIIVANVPEGLLPTVSLALAMGAKRMAKRNVLVRHLSAIETLGATTVICTDKTGTLTLNQMRVRAIWIPDSEIESPDLFLENAEAPNPRTLLQIARHCRSLRFDNSRQLGDPLEIALLDFAGEKRCTTQLSPMVWQCPFDSNRQRMATVHRAGSDCHAYVKGAPEAVLPRCSKRFSRNEQVPFGETDRKIANQIQEELAGKGMRVLAFAWRPLPLDFLPSQADEALVFAGLIALEDPPRPEVPAAIKKCREAGIRTIMVTGDHPATACAIARETGLIEESPVVITGDELSRLSDIQLQLALDQSNLLFARVTADQKFRIVNALKQKNEIVAVTGDGVNDAPALKAAHIGVSMGIAGSDVAKEASDLILMDDNFASIVAAVEEGRAIYANIRKFLTYILTSNVPELVPYLAFVLFRVPLALTILQILAVDLGTDIVPALALGAERPDADVMGRPPRPRCERLLSWGLLARAYLWLGAMQSLAAMTVFLFVLSWHGWNIGEDLSTTNPIYKEGTATFLTTIVLMQVANLFICRSESRPFLRNSLHDNPLLVAGIVVELCLLLLINYTSFGNATFGTAPVPVKTCLLIIPLACAMILLEITRKSIAHQFSMARKRRPAFVKGHGAESSGSGRAH